MIKSLRTLSIALAVLILLAASLNVSVLGRPVLATVEKPDIPCQTVLTDLQDEGSQQVSPKGADLEQELPIMKPSRETRQKWIERYNRAPKALINEQIERKLERAPTGSLSLLDHLQYTPAERNQGSCGNCWAWAGTGVMEVALDVQNGVKDRLSIQYLNSNYNGGSGGDWACCGGWLDDVADFYTGTGLAIPWSNTNASYGDGSRTCGSGSTSVPAGTISTTPYYSITSINAQTITTHGISQATAINNIKNILSQNKAVWFAFYLPTEADWDDFRDFWNNQPETAIWDPDSSCGHTWDDGGGGHAVLCVGYNDDDPGNRYWLILNSWGTAGGNRPDGLFRLAMDMDYSCTYYDPYPIAFYSSYWETLSVTFDTEESGKLIGTDEAANAAGGAGANYVQGNRFQALATGTITEFKVKVKRDGNIKVAIYADTGGAPTTRLWHNSTGVHVTTGWNTITVSPGVAVTQNDFYWLMFNGDQSDFVANQSATSGTLKYKVAAYSGFTFTDPAGSGFASAPVTRFLTGWGGSSPPPIPAAPVLASPADASTVNTLTPRLEWNTSPGAASYGVQVSADPAFGTTLVNQTGITSLFFDVPAATLNWDNTYYWRVNATNASGTSGWSTSWSFQTVEPPLTQKLIGTDEAANAIGGAAANYIQGNRFQALATGTITEFKVKVKRDGNIKVAIYADTGGTPTTRLWHNSTGVHVTTGWNTITVSPGVAVTQNDFYWLMFNGDHSDFVANQSATSGTLKYKVAAYSGFTFTDPAGSGFASAPVTRFLTGWGSSSPPPIPAAPVLASPADASTVNTLTPRLEWNTSPGAASYGVQVSADPAFGTTLVNQTGITSLFFDVPAATLNWDNTYYWRVNATNASGTSGWSTSWSFQTVEPSTTQKLIGTDEATNAAGGAGANYVQGNRFQALATGTITEFKVKVKRDGNIKVAIYADTGGTPTTRLWHNSTGVHVTTGWNTITVSPGVAVTQNAFYWLMFNGDHSDFVANQSATTGTLKYKVAAYSGFTFTDPAGSGFASAPVTRFLAGWGP